MKGIRKHQLHAALRRGVIDAPAGVEFEFVDRGAEGVYLLTKLGGEIYEVELSSIVIADTEPATITQDGDNLVTTFALVDNADAYVLYFYTDDQLTDLFATVEGDGSPLTLGGVNAPDLYAFIRVRVGDTERPRGNVVFYEAATATITNMEEDGEGNLVATVE